MLDNSYFVNHLGNKIEFGKNGVLLNYNTLRDYDWDYSADNNIINNFSKGIVKKTIPVIIVGDSTQKRDAIFEISEADIIAGIQGTFMINGYALSCFITGISTTKYLTHTDSMYCNLTISSDNPVWRKDDVKTFGIIETAESVGAFEYPYDYPYGYTHTFDAQELNNKSFMDASFEINIQGPVVDPIITIGENTYSIFASLEAAEFLTITSIADKIKTIVKTAPTGETTNIFNNRNKMYNNFAQIKPGNNLVSWSGLFAFEVKLIELRSEPKWSL